jgi:hypothetical protein
MTVHFETKKNKSRSDVVGRSQVAKLLIVIMALPMILRELKLEKSGFGL